MEMIVDGLEVATLKLRQKFDETPRSKATKERFNTVFAQVYPKLTNMALDALIQSVVGVPGQDDYRCRRDHCIVRKNDAHFEGQCHFKLILWKSLQLI
jgi:hypothetical protein